MTKIKTKKEPGYRLAVTRLGVDSMHLTTITKQKNAAVRTYMAKYIRSGWPDWASNSPPLIRSQKPIPETRANTVKKA